MTGRELGLGLQTNKRPGKYAELARTVEEGGFHVVTPYNDLWFQPALPALLEIAAATDHVRVGPSCLNPFTVHPVEIAGQMAALDFASGGRAFLGLAAGAWLDEVGVEQRRPAATVAEAWQVVCLLLAGDRSGFEGDIFQVAAGRGLAYMPLRSHMPLLVGTWSPRLTAFAAEHADELKVGGTANPDLVRHVVGRLGPAAARVGIVTGAVTVVDRDAVQAREHARREVAVYLGVVAALDPTMEIDPELIAALDERLGTGGIAAAAALVSDDLLDRFALAGTPEQVARHVEELFEAGARRVDFGTPHGLDERTGIDLLVREVAPRLAKPL